ncbi:MAG: hypothetical protein RR540_06600 [Oscillospiraceae bacterium]
MTLNHLPEPVKEFLDLPRIKEKFDLHYELYGYTLPFNFDEYSSPEDYEEKLDQRNAKALVEKEKN